MKSVIPSVPRLALALVLALASSSCTHTARTRARVHRELDQHAQALTTAVVDTLQLQPEPRRDSYTQLALDLAREDQRIEGLPPHPIPVSDLLPPGTNNATNTTSAPASSGASAARTDLAARFQRIRGLLATQRRLDDRLLDQGAQYEAAQNARRLRWTRWITVSTLSLGALVALGLFCPAILPLLGRLLAWLVSKIPALASALGVVSTRAFDAIVRAIEKSPPSSHPAAPPAPTRFSNGAEPPQLPLASVHPSLAASLDPLRLHLSREMDADHKRLVRARKSSLRL